MDLERKHDELDTFNKLAAIDLAGCDLERNNMALGWIANLANTVRAQGIIVPVPH